ncbi:hypothetical protein GCM10022267_89030 [Lentzea roselyniae]|uniref:Uncharacterized protein n=1 Tax=Lentzea roselyniae TaxID=531940 RepID=A0ABP7CDU7_9PSEU
MTSRAPDILMAPAGTSRSPTRYSAGFRLARVVLQIATGHAIELVDLTGQIAAAVADSGLDSG